MKTVKVEIIAKVITFIDVEDIDDLQKLNIDIYSHPEALHIQKEDHGCDEFSIKVVK